MKLLESDPKLAGVCRAVEVRLQRFELLATLELPVELLSDFDSLPEAKVSTVFQRTPAAYRPSERRLLVNATKFFLLQRDVSEAVLAHEIAHALCYRDRLMDRKRTYSLLSECIVADLLACTWGFFDDLRKERVESFGRKYCDILALWPDEDQFVAQMNVWWQRRLAGLS